MSDFKDLIAALIRAKANFKPIIKDKWNPHFQSHYADLASIRDATSAALEAEGLFIVQAPTAEGDKVTVVTTIYHTSGQAISASFSALAKNGSAQAVAAAVTFISRYALVSMLGLAIGEDDDGNATQRTGARGEPDGPELIDPDADPNSVFDMVRDRVELEAELKRRNVPPAKWKAIGEWLNKKDRSWISKAIASV